MKTDKQGFPMTPSRNNTFGASYSTGVSDKKQQSTKKLQNSGGHQFNQRGGHANSKVQTRAQRPQSKRLIDHSQPPTVKTHRTDKNELDKNDEDVVMILDQSMMTESSKKFHPRQTQISPKKTVAAPQD